MRRRHCRGPGAGALVRPRRHDWELYFLPRTPYPLSVLLKNTLESSIVRSLAEAAPDALFLVDVQRRILFASRRGLAQFGYTEEELIGQPVEILVPDAKREAHAQFHRDYVAKPRFRPMGSGLVLYGRRRDGSEFPVEITLSPVHTESGDFTAAAVRDISDRLAAERALREAEDLFRTTFDAAPIGMALVTLDWRIFRVNPALGRLLGYSVEELRQKSIIDVTHPDDRHLHETPSEELVRGQIQCFQLEKRYIRKDGQVIYARLSVSSVWDAAGRPRYHIGQIEDISEQRSLEMAREASLRWLHEVLDQCPVGIALVQGPSGERLDLNRHARALLTGDPAAANPTGELPLADEAGPLPPDRHPVLQAQNGRRITGLMLSLQRSGGEQVPVLLDAAPITAAEGGELQGAVVVFQDITIFKQIDRLRAEWNAVIAHDLRQPLNAISLSAQLIARRRKDATDLGMPLEQIASSVGRLNRMIGDLLDLSRLEARQLTLARSQVDIGSLIRGCADRIAVEAPDRTFELRLPPELPPVYVDADRIAQVMDNLLSNAIKYGEPGTPIHVAAEPQAGELAIAVSNHGAGIPATDLPRLFRRFARLNGDGQGRIKGIGLGLYIVQQLIEAHGGQVSAESTPGEKTTFRFRLPLSPRASL